MIQRATILAFIELIAKTSIVIALILLLGAGLGITIAHDPDNTLANYQAEVLANFAYSLLVIGTALLTVTMNREARGKEQ